MMAGGVSSERTVRFPALQNIALGVVSSLIATLIVAVIGPFVPNFTVDRQRFFSMLFVAFVAYVTGMLSFLAVVHSRASELRWKVAAGVLSLAVVTLLPASASVLVDDGPVFNWSVLRPLTPDPAPSPGPMTRDVELPVGTEWDVDNWDYSEDYDTRDLRLGSSSIWFFRVAEAAPDWTLDNCEDPEFRAWSDEGRPVSVDAEHLDFCMRTTTGATALLHVVEMPDPDDTVPTYQLRITTPG